LEIYSETNPSLFYTDYLLGYPWPGNQSNILMFTINCNNFSLKRNLTQTP
jgi:hypothetical protein